MSTRTASKGAALISALLLVSIACEADPTPAPGPSITIKNQRVELLLTKTREQQMKGLGGRDSLAWDHGMLFQYPSPGFPGFWMKDMRFDIDIVWIRDGRIVDISHRVKYSPEGPGPTIRPRELTDTVLEVPAGYAQSHGWRAGDPASFDLAESESTP